jgi:hypothetical protein
MDNPSVIDWRARFLASGEDADLPIVDAHQHYFDIEQHYYPWLERPPVAPLSLWRLLIDLPQLSA